jgi:hypothetical protein
MVLTSSPRDQRGNPVDDVDMWRTSRSISRARANLVRSSLADPLDRFADLLRVPSPSELRGHEDADQMSVRHDRQSTDLTIGDERLSVVRVRIRRA